MKTRYAHRSFTLLLAMLVSLSVGATQWRGDVDGNGVVDVSDVTVLVRHVLDTRAFPQADVDGNGAVNVSDVTALVNRILNPTPATLDGYDYIWGEYSNALPEVHIDVPLANWNRLLALYDANRLTKQPVSCKVTYVRDGKRTVIDSVAMKLRGNGSRQRPEMGDSGQVHIATPYTQWRHTGLGLNFRKWVKDSRHTIKDIRKVHLRYFYHDPTYVREVYSYDLNARAGVWAAPRTTYCRVWLHVGGDDREVYLGVYQLLEPIDKEYVQNRVLKFGSDKGYLWKCGLGLASLTNVDDANFGFDDESDNEWIYELKMNEEEFDVAKQQLKNFITTMNTKQGSEFRAWIESVCDVDLLLRTYAVMVALGNWDDYWNNANNYYLYFNSKDKEHYRVFFIPYDLDNTLGSSRAVRAITDTGMQNPMNWGTYSNPLIRRLLEFGDYRKRYIDYLYELADERTGLLYYAASGERIRRWQERIEPYVFNDTGFDCYILDEPSPLSNITTYRLLDDGPNNFFRVKCYAIKAFTEDE